MAKTYSAVTTATASNIAFQIEVSNVGTISLERSINGTKWVTDRSIEDMFVFSNTAEFNVQGVVVGQKLRFVYENCTEVSFTVLQ
ncbi:hypothetical protein BM127P2_00007 [Phocaeicola phage BM127P2]|nr:hypothetical protein BM127P1_00040 [Phocaeicola phage BM127P1]WAX08286.1 hypothetical protein BM127P2_00007 [Phocaeicola phage BM127P2]WAX08361.1 hypothetical protein BM127P3_00035 [Phocaeicola phage BM127P3]WAX08380.1 hypothetical protein BM127P4_00007 [Phocaeicola phage BM127P4]